MLSKPQTPWWLKSWPHFWRSFSEGLLSLSPSFLQKTWSLSDSSSSKVWFLSCPIPLFFRRSGLFLHFSEGQSHYSSSFLKAWTITQYFSEGLSHYSSSFQKAWIFPQFFRKPVNRLLLKFSEDLDYFSVFLKTCQTMPQVFWRPGLSLSFSSGEHHGISLVFQNARTVFSTTSSISYGG